MTTRPFRPARNGVAAPVLRRANFLLTGAVVASLLVVGGCATNGSTAGTTAAIVTTTAAPGTPLGPLQQRVYDLTRSSALAQGVPLDEACFTRVAANISDADAQLIIDATPTGDTPTLSAQGSSLAAAAASCLANSPSTSTTSA